MLNQINYKEALKTAIADEKVGIKIAKILGDEVFSLYITEIPPHAKVNPHYHYDGLEIYQILEGQGNMFIGEVTDNKVIWSKPTKVIAGDFFEIKPMQAHQLHNNFSDPLVLIFGCNPNHLGSNRELVEEPILDHGFDI